MNRRPLLPFPDYQRIYQVIFSVLETSGVARTHRACAFFASIGTLILRDHYGLKATISMGSLALMVDTKNANVVIYGREEGGEWVYDAKGFHAWVECEGWLIDFMAPIMGQALKEDGALFHVPSKMLQKHLTDRKDDPRALEREGDFFCHHDSSVAESVLDGQGVLFEDLAKVCLAWFRKPPKALPPLALGGNELFAPKPLVLKAPAITGAW